MFRAFGREIELVFRHGFRSFGDFFFDVADLAVDHGGDGWRRLPRLCPSRDRCDKADEHRK